MAAAIHANLISPAIHAPQLARAAERMRCALLWLTGLSGGFVFVEPSPYEVCSLVTIIVFVITGLSLRAALLPLIAMLLLYGLGFGIATIQVSDQGKSVVWTAVSWYLIVTAIFYAAMLGTNTTQRLWLLLQGYMVAAVVASIIAVLAYFRAFGDYSDMFLLYDRARGTFNDPNVLGAFVILPALLAFQRVLVGRLAAAVGGAILLAVFTAALLLSFSRAAWGQFALGSLLVMFLTFVTSRSGQERLRIILVALAGVMLLALLIVALLSVDRVAELFNARAALEQSYDLGPMGRFGRYLPGFILALQEPFGIGPLQFSHFFPEDPHNTYLNTFMSGGWLSGCMYAAMTLITLVRGLRFVFVATPWRPIYLVIYAAFVGTAVESAIIDSDHWRHYFLLLGVLWGLMAVARGSAGRTAAARRPALAQAGAAA